MDSSLKVCRKCGPLGGEMFTPSGEKQRLCRTCVSSHAREMRDGARDRDPVEYRRKQNVRLGRMRRKAATTDWAKHLARQFRNRGESPWKRGDSARDIVTREFLLALLEAQGGRCYISGVEMDLTNWGDSNYPSLDRIDANVGYVPGNMALCCRWINIGKGKFSVGEMKRNMERIRQVSFTPQEL